MFRAHRALLEVEFSCTLVTKSVAQSSEAMGKDLSISRSLLQVFHEKKLHKNFTKRWEAEPQRWCPGGIGVSAPVTLHRPC